MFREDSFMIKINTGRGHPEQLGSMAVTEQAHTGLRGRGGDGSYEQRLTLPSLYRRCWTTLWRS